jgi:hypothetical protein
LISNSPDTQLFPINVITRNKDTSFFREAVMQVIIAMMIKKEYSYKTSYKAGLVYDQSLLRIRKNQREKKERKRER